MSLDQLEKLESVTPSGFQRAAIPVESPWRTLVARPRIDSSTIEELREWIEEAIRLNQNWLVLDLRGTRFINLPAISYFEALALELQESGGALAFLGMPDKTRRIFEIYGSLKNIHLVDKSENLHALQSKILSPIFRLNLRNQI